MSMTPMIDVVFLLLIFFMLINSFGATQVLRFTTPAGERKSEQQDFVLTPVIIRSDGAMLIDGAPVAENALLEEMKKIKNRAAEVTILISVEPGATIQPLIRVVEAARIAGLKNVSMKKTEDSGSFLDQDNAGGGE
jgi:biopolymer transport protein ExbD